MPRVAATTTSGKRRRLSVMDRSDRQVLGELSQPASDDENITLELMKGSPGEPRPLSRRKSSILPDRRVSFRDFNTVKTYTPTRDDDTSDEEYDFAPHQDEVSKALEMFASENVENNTYSMPNIYSMGRNSVELRLSIGRTDDNVSEDDLMDLDSNTSAHDQLEKQIAFSSPGKSSPRRSSSRRSSVASVTMDITSPSSTRRTSVVPVASPEDLYKKSGRRMARDSIAPFFAAKSEQEATSPRMKSSRRMARDSVAPFFSSKDLAGTPKSSPVAQTAPPSSAKTVDKSPSKIPVLSPILKKTSSPKTRKNMRDSVAPFFPHSPYQPKKASKLRYATTAEGDEEEAVRDKGSITDAENHTQESISMDLSTGDTVVISTCQEQETLNRQESDVSATSAGSSWSTVASVEEEPNQKMEKAPSFDDDTISRFFLADPSKPVKNLETDDGPLSSESTPRKMTRLDVTASPNRRSSLASNKVSTNTATESSKANETSQYRQDTDKAVSEPSSPMTRSRAKAMGRMSVTSPLPLSQLDDVKSASLPNTPPRRRASARKSGGLFDTPPKHIQEKHAVQIDLAETSTADIATIETVPLATEPEVSGKTCSLFDTPPKFTREDHVNDNTVPQSGDAAKNDQDNLTEPVILSSPRGSEPIIPDEHNYEDDLMNEHLSVVDESFAEDDVVQTRTQELSTVAELFQMVGISWNREEEALPPGIEPPSIEGISVDDPISAPEIVNLHCIVASELATYEMACNNMEEDNAGIAEGVALREKEVNQEKPLVFFEYSQGSQEEKDEIMAAVQRTEKFCQLEAQESWYEWRYKFLETRLTDLGKYRAQLYADLNIFEQYNEHYASLIQNATRKREELQGRLQQLTEEKTAKEESERLRILHLKQQKLEQNERMEQIKAKLARLEENLSSTTKSIASLSSTKRELIEDIKKCEDICKEVTITESQDLSSLRDGYKMIVNTHGWKATSVSESNLVIEFNGMIDVSFEKSTTGSFTISSVALKKPEKLRFHRKSAADRNNYLADNEVINLFGSDTLAEMGNGFVATLKSSSTSFKSVLDSISLLWENLKMLAVDIQRAKCYFPMTISLCDTNAGVLGVDIIMDIFSFKAKQRYDLQFTIPILAYPSGMPSCLQIAGTLGETRNEQQEWIDTWQTETQKSYFWLSRSCALRYAAMNE